MIVEQIIDVPANRMITLEVPHTIPAGKTILTFTPASASKDKTPIVAAVAARKALPIEKIRLLLQKEMAEKGTLGIPAENGDGWAAHVRERYAQS